MATDPAPGLRERKKQATREALSWAALQLIVERGIENVLVEDIAASAGVSPRTFNNYFSSKAEAITFRHRNRMELLAATLRGRPSAEPLWAGITAAVEEQFGVDTDNPPDSTWTQGVRAMETDPAFAGAYLRAGAIGERRIAEAVAERTGADLRTDLHPHLVAAAVGAAIRIASQAWMDADPPVPLAPLLRSALTQIAAGLPAPG